MIEEGVRGQVPVQVAQALSALHHHVHVNELGRLVHTEQTTPSRLGGDILDDNLRGLHAGSEGHLLLEGSLDAARVAGEAGEAGVERDRGGDLLGVGTLEAIQTPAVEDGRAALSRCCVRRACLDRGRVDTEAPCHTVGAVSRATHREGVLTSLALEAVRSVGGPSRRIVRASDTLCRVDALQRAVVARGAGEAIVLGRGAGGVPVRPGIAGVRVCRGDGAELPSGTELTVGGVVLPGETIVRSSDAVEWVDG
jgi:hypothetical protein